MCGEIKLCVFCSGSVMLTVFGYVIFVSSLLGSVVMKKDYH